MIDDDERAGKDEEQDSIEVGKTPGGIKILLSRSFIVQATHEGILDEILEGIKGMDDVFEATRALDRGETLTDEQKALIAKHDVRQLDERDDEGCQ